LRCHRQQIHMNVVRIKWKAQITHRLVDICADLPCGGLVQNTAYKSVYMVKSTKCAIVFNYLALMNKLNAA